MLRNVDIRFRPGLPDQDRQGRYPQSDRRDFELHLSIVSGMPTHRLRCRQAIWELTSPSATILGIPRFSALEPACSRTRRGKSLQTSCSPATSTIRDFANETPTTRIVSIAGKLGVNIERFAKNIGEASGGIRQHRQGARSPAQEMTRKKKMTEDPPHAKEKSTKARYFAYTPSPLCSSPRRHCLDRSE